jgi:hypothetical protein
MPSRDNVTDGNGDGQDFVARIVKDPANPPQVRVLVGFLGAAADDAQTRVYLAADFSPYVDIPTHHIL